MPTMVYPMVPPVLSEDCAVGNAGAAFEVVTDAGVPGAGAARVAPTEGALDPPGADGAELLLPPLLELPPQPARASAAAPETATPLPMTRRRFARWPAMLFQ